ncbi:epoxide hydrolase family protein [Mycobacterium arosiense]|uniref:Epoxide hydrolase N-terminal domain-containing protein n=1 Tax=Mycobacterium arosiense ATCC BAA-1401 = DSM 45069 TaxID=1265311 RepID=A0A1W9Z748_MYCAI|nr:epoxide hydrolase family protein [Mycobacterium arosiense]ORA08349.1 hypothetical protein BST14_24360 [Mycobacterium arosiense ATCC BAA-1401 = DSM 45069]
MSAEQFEVAVPEADLDDLRFRLANTRWADDVGNRDWRYGVQREWLEDMVRYWRTEYDWRAQERVINRLANFRVTIDEVPLHFVHMRSRNPNAVPLLLLHGWPWTFMDFFALLDPLSDPVSHGGNILDSFDVIVPSLPGFGFSTPLTQTGLTVPRLAELFASLMTRVLGYERFAVGGGDWGAVISMHVAHAYPAEVIGTFTTIPFYPGLDLAGITAEHHTPDERWMLARKAETQDFVTSHFTVQSLDPQTLAYALVDSPAGTAAWLWERRRSWSDCDGDLLAVHDRDFLCTLASIYWLTGTIGTSLRIYWESYHSDPFRRVHDRIPAVEVPAGFAIHPKEVMLVPRSLAAVGTNLQRWSEMPRGGHFGFAEHPDALVEELRTFFRPLRRYDV